jgi:hypothetical protein
LAIKETQIRTALRSTSSQSERPPSITQTTNAGEDVGKNTSMLLWECQLVQLLWKAVWRPLKKLKMELPYDPVLPLLGKYPKACAPGCDKATCTPMFTAALCTRAKLWKQPATDEWMKKRWCIHKRSFIQP